ncbi:hypothetical protein BKA93DRAFT_726473, partial [Sparassis latifolia]
IRYLICIINGTRNALYTAVASDLVNAILKTRADKHNTAVYWGQREQERRLVEGYEKWLDKGGVWTATAVKVHEDQLGHVKKGCLVHVRQDVPSDESHIEGTHKGWNGLQCSFTSGIEVLTALCHDYILRCNVCIAFTLEQSSDFLTSTYGSHHIHLVDAIAKLWNTLLEWPDDACSKGGHLRRLPELKLVASSEKFGLVSAKCVENYQNLIEIKEEPRKDLTDLSSLQGTAEFDTMFHELQIDPALLLLPAPSRESSQAPRMLNLPCSGKTLQSADATLPSPLTSNCESTVTENVAEATTKAKHSPVMAPAEASAVKEGDNGNVMPVVTDGMGAPSSTPCARLSAGCPSCEVNSTVPSKCKADVDSTGDHTSMSAETHASAVRGKKKSKVAVRDDEVRSTLVSFFNTTHPAAAAKAPVPSPACTLPFVNITGLTASQRLFSVSTGVPIQSLSINSNDEFHLFMKLRAEKKWVSFSMTPRKWVLAASEYNRGQLQLMVRKTPRALMEKLGEIEPKIITRIVSENYTSKSNGETFWREHCGAVPGLVKVDKGSSKTSTHTCSQCKAIMWPGPEGAGNNHKKGYCSDGVMQKAKFMDKEHPPDWPQPRGIFSNGTTFHPGKFLAVIRELYDCMVVKGSTGGDRAMEYNAFTALLLKRTIISNDSAVLFKLFSSLTMASASTYAGLIVEHDGRKYLRIDFLHGAPAAGGAGAGGAGGNGNSEVAADAGEGTVVAVL